MIVKTFAIALDLMFSPLRKALGMAVEGTLAVAGNSGAGFGRQSSGAGEGAGRRMK